MPTHHAKPRGIAEREVLAASSRPKRHAAPARIPTDSDPELAQTLMDADDQDFETQVTSAVDANEDCLSPDEVNPARKPLLLWLQGSPGVSSLFGQFLANGPLGIDADGKLYHRTYSLIRDFNVIYLDQPAGAGYSFSEKEEYPGTLDEVALQVGRFLRRFLRIFTECRYSDFYIAGESYGARAAIAVATYIDKKTDIPLRFKGLMLGVGLVFPLMDIVDSANFLHTSGLLDEYGRRTLASWFEIIRASVKRQELAKAADELFKTVFNMPPVGQKTIFQGLTGFDHHGSIARTRQPLHVQKYFDYASSNEFKKIIHVGSDMALDKARREVAMQLAIGNFFEDIEKKVKRVFETTRVLFYTAQMDAVFPAANIEQSLKDLPWSWQETLRTARRKPWYRNDNSSLELFGYEFKVGTFTYTKLLGGGHDVSMDQSEAVCQMFSRFLKSRRS
ncbi:venom serine carboxypeptidase [Rhipicephalus microplus]|uniref:venom serine carboxypeptidase n=1 Tax=Rhipicephalus microplus TaxID=6941 RepID=UPI003F6C6BC1